MTTSDQKVLEGFYGSEERCLALIKEAMSWLKTPVVPHGAAKGHGVDCVSLVGEIYVATGALERYDKPHYAMDSGAHLEDSLLEQHIVATGRFEKIWERTEGMAKRYVDLQWLVRAGDCLCFSMGRVTHHVALALGRKNLIHAIAGPGVTYGELDDSTLARRVQTVYRPLDL